MILIECHACFVSVYSRTSAEVSLDPVVSQGDIEEAGQPSDKANVPSTSQEPSSSSAGKCASMNIYPGILQGPRDCVYVMTPFTLIC